MIAVETGATLRGEIGTPLALGSVNFGTQSSPEESRSIVRQAVDAGIRMIDTAPIYGGGESERTVGLALQEVGRDEIFLATKVGRHGHDPDVALDRWLEQELDASLQRLGTDFVDLYQIHAPIPGVGHEELLAALTTLVKKGKVRHLGSSNYPAWMVAESFEVAARTGSHPYASEQPPYNLLDRRIENELLPMCRSKGVAVFPWSPLAGGILSNRYSEPGAAPEGSRASWSPGYARRLTPRVLSVAQSLAALASDYFLSASQLALLWVKEQPGVTAPIIGPRSAAQLDQALAVVDLGLDEVLAERLDALVPPGNALADFHRGGGWCLSTVD